MNVKQQLTFILSFIRNRLHTVAIYFGVYFISSNKTRHLENTEYSKYLFRDTTNIHNISDIGCGSYGLTVLAFVNIIYSRLVAVNQGC